MIHITSYMYGHHGNSDHQCKFKIHHELLMFIYGCTTEVLLW